MSLAGLLCFAALWGCRDEPVTRPNVLLIVWDTVRADRLSLYGSDTTPELAHFFGTQGRIYDRAISPAPWTIPAHAAMFTGLFPTTTGTTYQFPWLDDRFETLAEHLGGAGYATYLFSANPNVSSSSNLNQGYQVEHHRGHPSADAAVDGFASWLAERPSEPPPFFATFNLMEAHWPRSRTSEQEALLSDDELLLQNQVTSHPERRLLFSFGCSDLSDADLAARRSLYDATLQTLDIATSRLLTLLEDAALLDDTAVIFTSDHGEHLGDNHLLGHQFSVHEGLLRVPLAIRFPSRFPPGRVTRPVQTIDLYRTILDLAQIDRPRVEGEESWSLSDREAKLPERRLLVSQELSPKTRARDRLLAAGCEEPRFEGLEAAELDGFKIVVGDLGRADLYLPISQPGEEENLRERHPGRWSRLSTLLDRWRSDRPVFQPGSEPPALDDKTRRRLEALGYI